MATNTARLILSRTSSAATRWLCSSTATETATKKKEATNLCRKLVAMAMQGTDAKLADTLDEWVKEGNKFKRYLVIGCVYRFRKLKKYDHAIQLYEWMDSTEKSKSQLNNTDAAIRIDLLAKTVGAAAAEEYFNSLQSTGQTKKTYGALLRCYCRENMAEKAEELFQKMRQLNIHANSINYNNMMSLYLNAGKPEKVPSLFEQMQKNRVLPDLHTYNHLINSYAAAKDLKAVEGVFDLMKTKNILTDWFTYGNVATIYVNAGAVKKANVVLKELERKKNVKDPEYYHTLIRLYGLTSNKDGVERAWKSLKKTFDKLDNLNYLMLLLALSKLGDIDGLEKYFREWESGALNYDIRIPNILLESYLSRDMVAEANLLMETASKRGTEPSLRTMNLFMNFYLKKQDVRSALEYLKAGASKLNSEKQTWFPEVESVNSFLTHFEEEKDGVSASEFSDILKSLGRLDSETEKRLNSVSGQ
ncbi:hypothetical protein Droror1_Dr00001892 [Drosera rotundifolia]